MVVVAVVVAVVVVVVAGLVMAVFIKSTLITNLPHACSCCGGYCCDWCGCCCGCGCRGGGRFKQLGKRKMEWWLLWLLRLLL